MQFRKFRRLRGGCFRMGGGYFPFFTENRPQKHKKHAILHTSQANGGARAPPPPPGYATDFDTCDQILIAYFLPFIKGFIFCWFYFDKLAPPPEHMFQKMF